MNLLTVLLVVGIDDAIVLGLFTILATVINGLVTNKMSEEANDRAITRAEDFARESTRDEREYNLPANQVHRMVDAGATEGGAITSLLGGTPYVSPPMSTVAPVSNAGNIASLMSMVGNSFGSFAGNVKSFEEAKSVHEMVKINSAESKARIHKMAVDNKWTETQITVSNRTLEMAEGRYEYEIKQMQQDFNRGMVEIDNLLKTGLNIQADTALKGAEINQVNKDIELKDAQINNLDIDTINKALEAKLHKLSVDYAKAYGVNTELNPFNQLIQFALSDDKAGDAFNRVADNVKGLTDAVAGRAQEETDTYLDRVSDRIHTLESIINSTFKHMTYGVGNAGGSWE